MSRPPNTTRPLFGLRRPETTSNNVVLPAPFGPIRPQIWPGGTSKATPSKAVIPPKRTVISSRARAACGDEEGGSLGPFTVTR